MSTPTTISIDGTEYIRADTQPALSGTMQIVVADRSWNFIGHTSRDEDNNLVINNAKVIRRWGTKSGLGQLALEGKQTNTVLDEAGTVTLPPHAVIALLHVNEAAWKS